MILQRVLFVVAGLVLLYAGGEFLVRGAVNLAAKLRIPALIIGLTVVAFGTSAPELAVSLLSAVRGLMAVSVANVIGSNIVNILLILGLAAVVTTIPGGPRVWRVDIPLVLVSYVWLALVAIDTAMRPWWVGGTITRWEGAIGVVGLVVYVFVLYRSGRAGKSIDEIPVDSDEIPKEPPKGPVLRYLAAIAIGVAGLTGGAELLVRGASWIAANVFHVSGRVIGITIVAFGTSLPELVTSVVAAAKKEMDISLGNIVGSNLFNVLMVLGTTALIRPIVIGVDSPTIDSGGIGEVAAAADFGVDFGIMTGATVLLLLVLVIRKRLERGTGIVFLGLYGGYLAWLLIGT